MFPLTFNSSDLVFKISSQSFDLYYWLKLHTRPPFINCLTSHFMYLSLYVYIGSSSFVLRLLKYSHPNPGNDKQSFIGNPVISSIALLYGAYEKAVHKTSFLT